MEDKPDGSVALDDEILGLAKQVMQLHDEAYQIYKPLAIDLCTRDASEDEVEAFLDAALDFAGEDKMLLLYRHVCHRYFPQFPQMVADYVYLWRDIYDPEHVMSGPSKKTGDAR